MAKSESVEPKAQKITEELLSLMGVKGSVTVSQLPSETPEEQSLSVAIDAPEEAGLLIGSHGTTLSALQSFLAIALKQSTGEWYRVIVDIGDWREKQEDYLKNLADQAAERAKATGEAQHLYNLSPNQRRVIHTALSEDSELITESQGEGESRFLIVRKKSE